jgi:phospholipid N-methyltransferase
VLNRLRRDGLLIVIDTNPMFIDYLKATISDSRFVAVNGSAADVEAIVRAHGHQNADYVLSACPFRRCPMVSVRPSLRPRIACCAGRGLSGVSVHLAGACLHGPAFHPHRRGMEFINVPPCFLYWGGRTRFRTEPRHPFAA